MADNRLNAHQIAVLEWVRAGCPEDGAGSGSSYRLSARALESRGLVKIRGRGSTWRIELTDAGRAWTQPTKGGPTAPKRSTALPLAGRGTGTRSELHGTPPSGSVNPDELLAEVIAAGGALDLVGEVDEALYRSVVKRALKSSARPRGKRLDLEYTGGFLQRRWAVKLVDYFEDLVDERAVVVPARVGKYHPVIREFLDDKKQVAVTRAAAPRAGRILEALVRAIVESGGTVERERDRTSLHGVPSSAYRLRATAGSGHVFVVHISERRKRVTHEVPESERRYSFAPSRVYEYVPTGELTVGVSPVRDASTRSAVTDGARALVEVRLGELMRTLEVECMYRDLRARKADLERQARLLRWEVAMERARAAFREDYERRHLNALASRWEEAMRLRSFVDAMTKRASENGSEPAADATAALARASAIADSLDPTSRLESVLCEIPEPKPDNLTPFLGGLSPYGPDGHR
ncbi:hypothetical protein QQX10_10640 [Demequina sp. SYSU T00039]|uniref:Uncharacterized protein n=1 Tax=Demequina lignilytica TaxID=3051663 RepID=A0AAW7M422_9MICO|nr:MULTISPECIES: hypothetical protein [unclassified Demequina]MDN4478646.1 hypothetical protein [Demequina sp. SYSU T00039-1]MDN4488624.1 hypothetical protein [Demequina sp. SYSU T00039]